MPSSKKSVKDFIGIRVTFVPFVISTSGVLGEKANIFLSLLERRLIQADPIAKLRKSISFLIYQNISQSIAELSKAVAKYVNGPNLLFN